MAIQACETRVDYIQSLADKPNTMDGMTSSKLKQQFDNAGAGIKEYINNTLVPAINSMDINYVKTNDTRLTDARNWDGNFKPDSVSVYSTARENLKIKTGTSLPSTVEEDCLFFLYS